MRKQFPSIFVILIALFLVSTDAMATHNRAGEITYRHLGGFTYEVTIFTCTDISDPNNADREYMPINWGDGSSQDSIQRVQEIPPNPMPADTTKQNIYTTTHVFPGPGTYILYSEDPNRNGGVNNIPNSIDQIFSIETMLVIPSDPFLGNFNNSVQLLNLPKDDACVGRIWQHNPGAFDPDGDSLAYELIPCTGFQSEPIPGYVFPDEFGTNNGQLTINQNTGTVTWDSPLIIGLYNLAIRISEYRNGVLVGYVVRDMQMSVLPCIDQPPVNDPSEDTCIVVGNTLSILLAATDPANDAIELEVFGESFELEIQPSTFTQIDNQPATGSFIWQPDCSHVRNTTYQVYVQAEDLGAAPPLSDIDVFSVRVVAPPVENLSTTVQGIGDVFLSWDVNLCDDASGYKVYRRIGSNPFTPSTCQTGLPEEEGYSLVAQTSDWSDNAYLDTDVPSGSLVCYRVVTCFPDGAESIVSEEVCASIPQLKPVITKVSIGSTDAIAGQDTLRWLPPSEIDTLVYTGPYEYNISRSINGGPFSQIESVSSSFLDVGEFELVDNDLDTENDQLLYEVAFLNDGEELSTSVAASSVFLTVGPTDNANLLTWTYDVPWTVDSSQVFVFDEDVMDFILLATVETDSYVHEGLVNGQDYCYVVRTLGQYGNAPDIPTPLLNFSQESCAIPFDNLAPCPPILDVTGDCGSKDFTLTWTDQDGECALDIDSYNIYYTPSFGEPFTLLAVIDDPNVSQFVPDFGDVVGCFAISSLDGLTIRPDGSVQQNESLLSDSICIPSCPSYELPNVITPNGDNQNDIFGPFEPYFFVDSVDLRIYNRWGGVVFETNDPDIRWDGTNQDSGGLVSDGVYFYTITIYEKTLQGLVPRDEAGTIQVLDNRGVRNQE